MKGVSGTCHYCSNRAKQNVVWLKDKRGKPARIILPHCGCDLMEAIRQFWPDPYPIQRGIDYEIEPLPEDMHHKVSGDGLTVTIQIRDPQGRFVSHTIPKLAARKLAKDVQEASHLPEPGCDDATDHWRGHCNCK